MGALVIGGCGFSAGCGYGSESEGEEAVDSNVTLPQSLPGRGNMKSQKSAIRLTEVMYASESLKIIFNILLFGIQYNNLVCCN